MDIGHFRTGVRCAEIAPMKAGNRTPGSRLRIVLEPDIAIGPGKADILQGIRDTGSIAAAGRRMGMSYKRAWYLVESMNRCFVSPLVSASKGGRSGGGTRLTELGETVLASYRRMETLAASAIAPEMKKLKRALRDV
jgi:molybdate transport system regulatory protein